MMASKTKRLHWHSLTTLILILLLAACSSQTPAVEAPADEADSAGSAAPVAAAQGSGVQPSDAAAVYKLPDLDGRTVVAVTGNDYIPLNYVDPLTGASVGWEYDAVNEICRRLNCQVDWQVSAWDTMIQAVRDG